MFDPVSRFSKITWPIRELWPEFCKLKTDLILTQLKFELCGAIVNMRALREHGETGGERGGRGETRKTKTPLHLFAVQRDNQRSF